LVRKTTDIKGSDIPEPNKFMNLSLLIGPDRFTYLVYFKEQLICLSICEWKNEADLLSVILKSLRNDHIELNILESISLSFFVPDDTDFTDNEFPANSDSIREYFIKYPVTIIKDCKLAMLQAFGKKYPSKSAIFSFWQSGKIYFWYLNYSSVDNQTSCYFKTAEDALYHTLLFYKKNGLSTENDPLFLSGNLSEDSAIFSLLSNYVSSIEFVKNPTELILNTSEDLPEHLFFDILSTSL